jgi:predicted small lipoprotein YifL
MKTIRLALAIAALSAALTACGDDGSGSAAPAAPAAPPAASGVPADGAAAEAEVEAAFRGYWQALLARDFPTACAFNTPETNAQLLAGAQAQGVTAASCEEALDKTYAVPGAAEAIESTARTSTVEDITVTGDDATIRWSAELNGERPTVTSGARRIDGAWRLVYTGA